jgi:diacylglycerol diphosphate phosphatase/phosphatidate phosphatase
MLGDSLKRRLLLSYGTDWALVIIIIVIFFSIDLIAPFHRDFSINDTTLMHKYTVHETVPVWLLGVSMPIVLV